MSFKKSFTKGGSFIDIVYAYFIQFEKGWLFAGMARKTHRTYVNCAQIFETNLLTFFLILLKYWKYTMKLLKQKFHLKNIFISIDLMKQIE